MLYSFKQAREMLRVGELSTVKILIERYVQKIIINGEYIEVRFNLNVNSRVFTYSADTPERQKEIPQFPLSTESEVLNSVPMLGTTVIL